MPYGRCAIYSFEGDEQELIEKSRAGILPIFKQQPGFIAYGVMVQNGQIISMSAWDSESDARAADEAARQWVSENINAKMVNDFVGDYAWLEFAKQ
jgi:heme-degrading monooxygenase HmoA